MFSGGFDSTALLLSKLGENINSENKQLYNVISVYHENITNKDQDKEARDRIKEILQKEFPEEIGYFNFREIKINDGGISGQASIWPTFALYDASLAKGDDIDVWLGYVRGDDFWHSKGIYLNLYECYEKIIHDYTGNHSKIKVNFPFEWHYKNELVYLYSTVPDVFGAISWGGDDGEVKLKEKQELKNIFEQIMIARKYFKEPKKSDEGVKESLKKVIDVYNQLPLPVNHVEVSVEVKKERDQIKDEWRGQYEI